MEFRIKAGGPRGPNEAYSAAAARIARELLTHASETISAHDELAPAVHGVRKSLKKMRGLLRLVRPAIGRKRFQRENVRYRDLSRELSALRDAQVLIETLDWVWSEIGGGKAKKKAPALRRALIANRREAVERWESDVERRRRLLKGLEKGRAAIGKWRLDRLNSERAAVAVADIYHQGRRAQRGAAESRDAHDFHDWRKPVKYLWYQARILHPAAPRFERLIEQLDELGEVLGREHDLFVLSEWSVDDDATSSAIEEARRRTQERALALGGELYDTKAKSFRRRLTKELETW